jgi:hypothetical protein
MIQQIAPILAADARRAAELDRGLAQARDIQSRLKNLVLTLPASKPETGKVWHPDFAAPYVVPVMSWIE